MKIRKILALLLAAIMLCGLFAVVPASAAETASASIFEAYEAEKHNNWWQPATKDGYDGFLTVNSSYAISSKEAYDMEANQVVISDLDTNSQVTGTSLDGYRAVVMFAPTAATSPYSFYHNADETSSVAYEDEDALCLAFVKNDESGYVRISTLANNSDATQGTTSSDFKKVCGEYGFDFSIPVADTYEISFAKKVKVDSSVDEDGVETEKEYLYLLRINDYYVTGDENSRLAKFYNSGTVYNSIVSISAQNLFEGNVDIEKADTFISSNGKTSTMKANNADGSQTVFLQNDTADPVCEQGGEVATAAKHDLITNELSIKNISWYNHTGSTIFVNLSSKNRYGEISKGSYTDENESVLGIRIQSWHASSQTMSISTADAQLSSGQAGGLSNHTAKKDFGLTKDVTISFIEENGTYYLVFCGLYLTNDYITNFVKSGAAANCYISMAAYLSATVDVSVEEKGLSFISDNNTHGFNIDPNANGELVYNVGQYSNISTSKKVDVTKNFIELTNTTFASESDLKRVILSYNTSHYCKSSTSLTNNVTDGRLMLGMYMGDCNNDGTLDDEIWVAEFYNQGNYASTTPIAKIPYSADGYKIAVVKEDDTYVIYVNETKVSSNNINTYFANNAENTYITIGNYDKVRVKLSIKVESYENDSTLTMPMEQIDIVDSTIVNTQTYTTVKDITVNEAEGYTVTVTDKNGNALTADDFVASGDKVTINYKGWFDVVTYDLIVLADTDGDRDITGIDAINIQKELLGVAVDGVYSGALNVKYDDAVNILDFIAIKKLLGD